MSIPMQNGTAPVAESSSSAGGGRLYGVSPSSSYTVLTNNTGSGGGGSQATNSSFSNVHPFNMSSLTDITLEQAMDKVQELAQENSSLRECLRDNNENMKKQYQLLLQWKEKVRDSNKANLSKFEELQRTIATLRAENDKYRQCIASPEKQGSVLEELQTRIRSLQDEKMSMQQEREALQKNIDQLKSQLGDKSPEKDMVIVSTMSDTAEVEGYKKRCIELATQVQNFHQQNEQLMQDLQQVSSLKQSIQAENTKLNQDNLELQKKIQGLLGGINKSKYSVGATGGNGEGNKSYNYDMSANEDSERVSSTAKQDMEILDIQTAATERVSSLSHQEEQSSTELSHELKLQRQTSQSQQQKIGNQEQLISQLKSKLQEKDAMVSHYKQQLESQIENITQEHLHKQQVLMKQLDDLNAELQQTKSSDVQNLKSQVISLIKESQELSSRLENTSRTMEEKNSRVFELERIAQQQASELEEVYRSKQEDSTLIQNLKCQLARYDESVSRERQEHATSKHQLTELRASFNRLVNDYKELLDTFDKYKAGNQNKQLMDEINRLTAQTIAAEEAITYRDDQIKQLKQENSKLKEEIDNTIPVLRAQADVWKMDFDAERSARERQVAEKEGLLSELRNLEMKNQQLIDEMESVSRKSLAEMQRRHAPSSYQSQMQNYLQVGSPGGQGGTGYQQQGAQQQASPGAQYPGSQGSSSGSYSPRLIYPHPPGAGAEGSPGGGAEHAGQQQQQQPQPQGPPTHLQQPASHGSSSSHADDSENQMTCPKCGISCPDLDTLQIHVMDCLDN